MRVEIGKKGNIHHWGKLPKWHIGHYLIFAIIKCWSYQISKAVAARALRSRFTAAFTPALLAQM